MNTQHSFRSIRDGAKLRQDKGAYNSYAIDVKFMANER